MYAAFSCLSAPLRKLWIQRGKEILLQRQAISDDGSCEILFVARPHVARLMLTDEASWNALEAKLLLSPWIHRQAEVVACDTVEKPQMILVTLGGLQTSF